MTRLDPGCNGNHGETDCSPQYLPFGAGRHRCIGEQYAIVQLTIVVSIMVRHFKLSNVSRKGVVATDYSVSLLGFLNISWMRC